MVVRTADSVLMLMLRFGRVVMRAVFAVLMLVLRFGRVVVRAVFAVLVLVFSFGCVVMITPGTMHMASVIINGKFRSISYRCQKA